MNPRRLALAALLGLGPACGSPSLDVARYPHPEGAPAEPVGFPPPPAQIEQLGERPPAPGCRWADGQWVWAAQRWDWRPGDWVRPPEGCRYSPPTLQWAPASDGSQGVLYYRPGRWYAVSEPKICPDAVSCTTPSPARSSSLTRGRPNPRSASLTRGRPNPRSALLTRGRPNPRSALLTRGRPNPRSASLTRGRPNPRSAAAVSLRS